MNLMSRNGNDMTAHFPEVAEVLRAIPADLVVDGELVICDDMGCTQWHRLQKRHVLRRADRIREAANADPACIFAFDLLWLDGADYRNHPLVIRKAMLHKTLTGSKRIIYATHFEDSIAHVWALAEHFELEGVVAKDGSSIYSAVRTTSWQKIKTNVGAERERQRRPRQRGMGENKKPSRSGAVRSTAQPSTLETLQWLAT